MNFSLSNLEASSFIALTISFNLAPKFSLLWHVMSITLSKDGSDKKGRDAKTSLGELKFTSCVCYVQ